MDLSGAEEERLHLQAELDAAKSQAERNRLGQFATPTALASDVLECAKALLPSSDRIRFFDPGFGLDLSTLPCCGRFLRTGSRARKALRSNPLFGDAAIRLWGETPLNLHTTDFTLAPPPATEKARCNLLVCNPPYVRHHHISSDEKLRLQEKVRLVSGVRMTGLTGLYCYFLGLAHPWMAEDCLAGWLIPSEFMDVNYGRAVKSYLLSQVTLLRIHRFDPQDVQFGDALVSSAVVWFRNRKPRANHEVEFTFGGTLTQPKVSRKAPTSLLEKEPKWTRFPLEEQRGSPPKLTLGDLFSVKRGIATGNNDYFVLTKSKIEQYDLPAEFLHPVLPSPRALRINEIQADALGNPMTEPQLFLLDCALAEEEITSRYPGLAGYLAKGREQGVNSAYLCAHRSPWYSQEARPPAPILCTYMGRSDGNGRPPFRFIMNHSRARATNLYLLMYPKAALQQELRKQPQLLHTIWLALNEIPASALTREGRVYGGGLNKMEPRELLQVPLDQFADTLPDLLTAARAQRPTQLGFGIMEEQ